VHVAPASPRLAKSASARNPSAQRAPTTSVMRRVSDKVGSPGGEAGSPTAFR
jgi:hypothetical protein